MPCLQACGQIREFAMQQEGMVSLWAGHADSASALEDYLKTSYSEDGDLIPSSLANDFGISYYDEDFREARHYDKPLQSISDLLRDYSYDNMVIPKFVQLLGESLPMAVNAVVLLYNYKHDSEVEVNASGPVTLRFMGTVSME